MIHLMMQATVVTVREKKKIRSPVMTAPIMLVAANVTARRITDVRIVPSIPARREGDLKQMHRFVSERIMRKVEL